MTSAITSLMPPSLLTQNCFLSYIGTLQRVPLEPMEGSPFSRAHIDAHVSRELDRMDIPVLTPKLLAACYFVDRITQDEGRLYEVLGADEPSRHQLLSGALRVHSYFRRERFAWMEDDPTISGAVLLELSELQRLRLHAYKTVMDWKADVQYAAPDLEEYVHPRELKGLLPALEGLQNFFAGLLNKASAVDVTRQDALEVYFFPSGRPDSGNISVLPNGEIGVLEEPDEAKTDPSELYVTPTAPQVMIFPSDKLTPTAPLPLVVAKQEQVRAETPPIPLVQLKQ